MDTVSVTCPSCFERFEIPRPPFDQVPGSGSDDNPRGGDAVVELDYDCEVCCRPMILEFRAEGDEIVCEARSLDA